ncbi:hypothetical protein [Clostridium beijerinckii]|nr:hypothetical protein [Clostridium beijerinckii]NOW04445.1 hypothetical protein [Clostridium beijerinckii]NYC02413.1 hypothetical protein [Clostridium beijerinckii]
MNFWVDYNFSNFKFYLSNELFAIIEYKDMKGFGVINKDYSIDI